MARQIIIQPDGNLSIWSTIIDDFLITDITKEDYIKFCVDEAKEKITEEINTIVKKLIEGGKPYYQWTMTYEEALDNRRNKGHEEDA